MKAKTIAIAIGAVALLLVAVMLLGARNGQRPAAGFVPAASSPWASSAASSDAFKVLLEARGAASSAVAPQAQLSREQIQQQFKSAVDAQHAAGVAAPPALQRKEQGR